MIAEIKISEVPNDINYSDIIFKKGDCIENSLKLAKKYPSIEMVEGAILIIDKSNCGQAFAHFWNKRDDIYFDITKELIWLNDQIDNNTKEIKYVNIKIHQLLGSKKVDLEFCDETKEYVTYLNNKLYNIDG